MANWLQKQPDIGLLILRIFIGTRLLYGVMDNIISWQHMLQFEAFLKTFHFPFPLLSAIVSVYAQAAAGLLLLIGYQTRWAALLMVLNFLVAYGMVHWGQPYDEATAPLAMLFIALCFLFTGAGRYSLDGTVPASTIAVLYPEKS